jgi:hypothetical protein
VTDIDGGDQKVADLAGWLESKAFSDLERVALEYAERMTYTPVRCGAVSHRAEDPPAGGGILARELEPQPTPRSGDQDSGHAGLLPARTSNPIAQHTNTLYFQFNDVPG